MADLTQAQEWLLLAALSDKDLTDKVISILNSADSQVVGPGSSTTNAITKFADATGNLLANSGITIDSSNNLSGVTLASASRVAVASGTAAAPSVTFTGDLDTGVFRSAANKVGISTNGHEVVTFTDTNFLFSDGGAGVTASFQRPDNAGVSLQLGNGTNAVLGQFLSRNGAGTQTNFGVTDAGAVTIGFGSSTGHTLNTPTTTTATAGSNGDVPAQVVGYVAIVINGVNAKIPFYAA